MLTGIDGYSVAAGAGGVFSASLLHFGTSPFSAAFTSMYGPMLYLPAEGVTGGGGVKVKVSDQSIGRKLEKRCDKRGKAARAAVTVTGENGFAKTVRVGVCTLLHGGSMKSTIDLLDPGPYTVAVTTRKRAGQAAFTVAPNRTKPVTVKTMNAPGQ